jgi:hypothetical protein
VVADVLGLGFQMTLAAFLPRAGCANALTLDKQKAVVMYRHPTAYSFA